MLYNKALYGIPSHFNSKEERYEKRGRAKISSSDSERCSEIEHFWTWMLKLLRRLCFPHMCTSFSIFQNHELKNSGSAGSVKGLLGSGVFYAIVIICTNTIFEFIDEIINYLLQNPP